MDSNVPKIQPRDQELARIQNNLANTLQGVLDQQNAQAAGTVTLTPVMQQLRGPGTPYSVKIPALKIRGRPDGPFQVNQPTVVLGSPASVTTPQRDASLFSYGQSVWFGSAVSPDGFVIIPQVSGPAFRVAPNNAANAFLVNFDGSAGCSGPFNAPSVRSDAGFKSWLPPLSYWNPNFPGGLVSLVVPVVQTANGTASTTVWIFPCVRSGSITALTCAHTGATNMVCAVYLYKNNAQVYSYNITNQVASGYVAIPKGTLPFVAGDTLTAKITYGTAGINVCTQIYIEVEEVA